jgi:hypothetical protein
VAAERHESVELHTSFQVGGRHFLGIDPGRCQKLRVCVPGRTPIQRPFVIGLGVRHQGISADCFFYSGATDGDSFAGDCVGMALVFLL